MSTPTDWKAQCDALHERIAQQERTIAQQAQTISTLLEALNQIAGCDDTTGVCEPLVVTIDLNQT